MNATRRIAMDDGVFVHGHLIFQDSRGSWWAYRDGTIRFSPDRDDLLAQIARAIGSEPDVDDLRGRLARSIELAERRREEDEAVQRSLRSLRGE